MNLIINTDGASRGNPGLASYGFVIKSEDGVIRYEEGQTLGVQTNNFAEYTAVLRAFEYIQKHYSEKKIEKITLLADSKLAIEQLSGRYKIKNPVLKTFFEKIKILEFDLPPVFYKHVPREENFLADRVANMALDRS